jgi:hypothetical protein
VELSRHLEAPAELVLAAQEEIQISEVEVAAAAQVVILLLEYQAAAAADFHHPVISQMEPEVKLEFTH